MFNHWNRYAYMRKWVGSKAQFALESVISLRSFFHKNLFHIIYIFWQCILTVSLSTSCCWYIIFTLPGHNTVTSVIASYKYQYCKYSKTIWTDLSNSNSSRPVLQTPQCIRQTSLNAPLRTEMCPSPLWTVHRGTLPRHHPGHRWLSVELTLSARRRIAHRLKAAFCGRKSWRLAGGHGQNDLATPV